MNRASEKPEDHGKPIPPKAALQGGPARIWDEEMYLRSMSGLNISCNKLAVYSD